MDTPTDRPTKPDESAGAARPDSGADPPAPPASEPPLKHHGDALLDKSGTRHGESPPRVEPDAGA